MEWEEEIREMAREHAKNAKKREERLLEVIKQWKDTRRKIIEIGRRFGIKGDALEVMRASNPLLQQEIEEHVRRLGALEEEMLKHLKEVHSAFFLRILKHLFELPDDFWKPNGPTIGELLMYHNPGKYTRAWEKYVGKLHYPIPKDVARHLKESVMRRFRELVFEDPEKAKEYLNTLELLGLDEWGVKLLLARRKAKGI